jgi:hypothetical protein
MNQSNKISLFSIDVLTVHDATSSNHLIERGKASTLVAVKEKA